MVETTPILSRKTLPLTSIPPGGSSEYEAWVERLVDDGLAVVGSMNRWRLSSQHQKDTVQTYVLPCHHSGRDATSDRPKLAVHDHELWAGRRSLHFVARPSASGSANASRRGSAAGLNPEVGDADEEDEQGDGLFEAFEQGLFERHSENEKEYIESLREVSRVGVICEGESEVWKCVYTMPSPLNSRTFMNLLITRRLPTMPMDLPPGWHTNHPPPPCRQFIIITLPVDRPSSPDTSTPSTPTSPLSPSSERSLDSPSHSKSTGGKEKTVRARYVSVEWVKEVDLQLTGFEHGEVDGGPRVVRGVEWAMATSSSAGGNVPQAVMNMALPSKITEDVPAFIAWMRKQNPQLGKVESKRF